MPAGSGVKKTAPKNKPQTQSATISKLSFKESKELEALPKKIEVLEQEQAAISERLTDTNLYRSQPAEAKRLQARLTQIESELAIVLARWEQLEAKHIVAGVPAKV